MKDDLSDKYTNEKEFKHYVPQNTKPSFIQNRIPPSNPSLQGGNYNKHLTFSQQQLVANSSTSYKQNNLSNPLAQGLYGKNPIPGNQKSLQSSQACLNQGRSTMMSNHNGSINFVPGSWRKN